MSERRKFSRISFSGHCYLSEKVDTQETQWNSELLDISLNGALIKRPDQWQDHDNKALQFNLKFENSDVELRIKSVVCHQEKTCLGIKFIALSLESISHIKRLVQLNLADESLLNREISQLINIDPE
ncbi:type IV pilus assembly PilZ [Psychromonas sp. CNPT3]|uniref:PilZ domain-containing protein n=1 Tax=Psychromonas sp. CNPT3 TaxID=314282 RepID=UPI00006E80F8|nr:PilZ domain-containing protein [Psychromonas sp. CNPT3]AGH81366.1 type IV pilus assembly PilZ [Psychromonas sp. CNPT3]